MKIIWTLFKQNKYLNLLNVIVSTIFLFLLVVLIINIDQSNVETSTARNFKEKNLYQISDSLIDEKGEVFFREKANYDVLHNFSSALSRSTVFDYYSAIWQPIGIADFKGDRIFDAYYDLGSDQPPYEINGKSYSAVKSIRFNKTVFQLNDIQLESGREFENEEYIFDKTNPIMPIILGADYSKLYAIGDYIEVEYYQKEFKGIVIGFLSPFQKVMTTNEPEILLDRYMILPVVDFNELPTSTLKSNLDNELFIIATLLTNSNGAIITEDSPLEIREILDQITMETGFSDFSIIGANSVATDLLFKMTKQNKTLLYVMTFLLFIMMTIIFIFTTYLKIKKNVDSYLVLLISGLNLEHVHKIVRFEFIFTNIIGSITPIIFLLYLTKGSTVMLTNYLFVIAIFVLVSMIPINIMIKKTFNQVDIVQKLKG